MSEPRKTDLLRALELAPAVAAAEEPGRLFEAILDAAIELTGAERGSLVTVGRDDRTEVVAARHSGRRGTEAAERRISLAVLGLAVDARGSLLIGDARTDPRTAPPIVDPGLGVRSVLATPLLARGELVGILLLEDRRRADAFDDGDCRLLELVAAHAALAALHSREHAAVLALNDRLQARVERLETERARLARRVQLGDSALRRRSRFRHLVGASARFVHVLGEIESCAASDLPVLITGESGTGKELVARTIHEASARAKQPFVAVNVPALAGGLFESELFGHRKGAFTGAHRDHEGLAARAEGGTLLLDEIGDLGGALQAKLLRFLQERAYRPIGASEPVPSTARVLAVTSRDLRAMVEAGTFRADLYHRLRVLAIEVPPLRERPDDVPLLARHFVARMRGGRGTRAGRLSPTVLERLAEHRWPGNVRELEAVVHRAVLRGHDPIRPEDLDLATAPAPGRTGHELRDLERETVLAALREERSQSAAARRLGIDRVTLWRKLKRWGIESR